MKEKKYTVAAYYFPQWHPDPANEEKNGKGWTEWVKLKKGIPRFPGHNQPKVPLWGYLDESDPETSQKQINAAADHGIDVFIYDWYWDYNGEGKGPFLQSALEKGFLAAPDKNKLQFALMWANHREVDSASWEKLTDYVIEHYFSQPNYWKLDGALYFSIYELHTFIKGFGGKTAAVKAIQSFRDKAVKAGYSIHLNCVEWGLNPDNYEFDTPAELINDFKIDSVTSYCWIHNYLPFDKLHIPYRDWRETSIQYWQKFKEEFPVPYHPNVSQGWDSSGRFDPAEEYIPENGYFCSIISENTPQEFENSLNKVKEFLDKEDQQQKIVTLYAWNEWTEGGYLEPDTVNKTGYLEAVKKVFPPK